ncbi:MAG: TlpA family protein disulfide reductase [Candidatus Promineifilaceae bacterium]
MSAPGPAPAPGRPRLALLFAGFVLIGAAAGLLLFAGEQPEAAPAGQGQAGFPAAQLEVAEIAAGDAVPAGGLEVGDRAYNFSLPNLDGERVSMADYRGRPLIVNFWATWCAPCRIEMPVLQAAYERHQADGLAILAVNEGEPAEVARAFFYDEMGLTFTPLLDENSAVGGAYASFNVLPTSYFINAAGQITAVHRGPMTAEQIKGYLEQTL